MDFTTLLLDPQIGEPEQQLEYAASSTSSATTSGAASSSSTSSTSSVEIDIIAKASSLNPSTIDCRTLAVGLDEADKHFPSRTPSPAICTATAVASPASLAVHPATHAHGSLGPFDPHPILDNKQTSKKDVAVPQNLLPPPPPSSDTAIGDVSLDRPENTFTEQKWEVARDDPILEALFSGSPDDEDTKDVNDDSIISVPKFGDSSGSCEPPSNETTNTSMSVDEEEVKDVEKSAKRATRRKQESVFTDAPAASANATRASSRLRGATSGRRSGKFAEGYIFETLKDFFELASPRIRENNHHVEIHVQEDFDEELELSIMSASMTCMNKETSIRCGCTIVALQKLDKEHEQKMQHRKSYRPKFKWQITVYQPEHCLECLTSTISVSEEQVVENHNEWLREKAYYENGNKISEVTDDEMDGADERATSRRSSNKSTRKSSLQKVPKSARRDSSQLPIPDNMQNDGSDMDMSISDDEARSISSGESEDDEVITVQASFSGPSRLSQVKKEGTPSIPSSSKYRAKVYRETQPLGPIPGRPSGSTDKNKSRTSTRDFYGTASSSSRKPKDASSSAQKKKLAPPANVLRDHAKLALKRAKASSSATSSISSASLGLRKRSRSESETSVTPEPPVEPFGKWTD